MADKQDSNVTYMSEDKYDSMKHHRLVIDYKNPDALADFYFRSFLNKTQSMFEWKGLPPTMIARDMEMLIQTRGFACVIEHKGNYYALWGHLGGRRNFDYMPSMATIANPYLELTENNYDIYYGYDNSLYDVGQQTLTQGRKCVVIPNDPQYIGLTPILTVYANRMAENSISRRVLTITSRAINVFIGRDNNAVESVKTFLQLLEKGVVGVIADNDFIGKENVTTLPFGAQAASARMITELIEAEQYDKASLYNELGLQANYNMKRESINSDEAQLGVDAVLPLSDAMLRERQIACERIKQVFGLDISVDFSSAWKFTRQSLDQSLEEEETDGRTDPDDNERISDSDVDSNGNGNG